MKESIIIIMGNFCWPPAGQNIAVASFMNGAAARAMKSRSIKFHRPARAVFGPSQVSRPEITSLSL